MLWGLGCRGDMLTRTRACHPRRDRVPCLRPRRHALRRLPDMLTRTRAWHVRGCEIVREPEALPRECGRPAVDPSRLSKKRGAALVEPLRKRSRNRASNESTIPQPGRPRDQRRRRQRGSYRWSAPEPARGPPLPSYSQSSAAPTRPQTSTQKNVSLRDLLCPLRVAAPAWNRPHDVSGHLGFLPRRPREIATQTCPVVRAFEARAAALRCQPNKPRGGSQLPPPPSGALLAPENSA